MSTVAISDPVFDLHRGGKMAITPTVALADPPPLERAMRLEVHGSVAWLSDDDLDATYGPLPGGELVAVLVPVGIGIVVQLAAVDRLFPE